MKVSTWETNETKIDRINSSKSFLFLSLTLNFIIFSDPPVDCAWGDWSEYSDCSVECAGDGTKTRTRTKAVEASNGGFDCSGSSEEAMNCNNGPCGPPGCVDKNPSFCNKYDAEVWFRQWCFIDKALAFFGGETLVDICRKSCSSHKHIEGCR